MTEEHQPTMHGRKIHTHGHHIANIATNYGSILPYEWCLFNGDILSVQKYQSGKWGLFLTGSSRKDIPTNIYDTVEEAIFAWLYMVRFDCSKQMTGEDV